LLIKEFNEIVETKLVKKSDWIIDVTWIYKFFIENNLIDVVKDIKWYMPEGEVCVRYWGKVVLVPVVKWYSTTNIVEKILDIYCK
jgi:primase-polymerase (primpol)-like protein